MRISLMFIIAICMLGSLAGCGGGSSTPPPPVATHFSVVAATGTPTVGNPFNITVTALDATGQMVATFSGTVHFTSSSGQPVSPATGMLMNGSGTFVVTLSSTGNQTISVSDGASLSGTSSMLTVSLTVAAQLVISAPGAATAGTAFSFTVTARDASNNVVTTYSGTVHFTSSDPQAVLPANATLTNGTGTFSITLKTANGETITATDTATASITGTSSGINVAPGSATHLFVTAPATASAGQIITFGVSAQDTYGNVATGYTGTVHFATNDAQAVPPANTTLTGGGGSQAFSIALKTIQSTTITATDTVTASITGSSSPITVVSNAATHLSLNYPFNATTRVTFSVGIYALDALNNPSLSYTGTAKLTSTDAQAIFGTNPTQLTNGVGQFSLTFETVGSQTVTATDAVTPSLTASSSAITVTAASTPSITSGAPPNGTFGVNYAPNAAEPFLCVLSGFPFPQVECTTPCDSSNSNCAGFSACRRQFPTYPCVTTKTVFAGFTFAAKGGLQPYSWTATGLPPGLSVIPTNTGRSGNGGRVLGTPTSPGTYKISVTVTDSGNPPVASPASNYTIIIKDPPPPVINATPAPPNGAVNLPYSFTFTATSPAAPFTWRVSVGTLPAGLTLNPDGVLSGTPTTVGTTSITLIATDEFKQDSAPQVFSIQIFAHGFEATGSLATARTAATATLLNTGKVLVAGGTSTGSNALSSAELYDSTSKTFSATGSMATGRHDFAATLLPSGKVLVTGGLDGTGNPLASAELYDPVAGTFSPTTGPMTIARASHTSTLLNTGKVLIAGWGPATAELFDPATGTFTQTGSMVDARTSHTATLLANGKVLIAAGTGAARVPLNEAELYDPTSGSFAQTLGMLTTFRTVHTATLLKDGSVLITGGLDGSLDPIASAEVFNPTTQMFTAAKGNMETGRAYHKAVLLSDGTVLITGGNTGNGTSSLSTAELYDPAAGTFSPTGDMVSARQSHTATLLTDGTVLVTGGTNGVVLTSAELYK